jgi:DNA-binding transcriptional MerR regulator/methylmalonyl-CoA mutase cobalamin-binding subunit
MAHSSSPTPSPSEALLSVGAVVRLTGLSEHVLRAWERRYGAVIPIRTPGGTRRYRESDVKRLRLLRDAIAGGSRIGDIAGLDEAALLRRCSQDAAEAQARPVSGLREMLAALKDFELERAKEIVSLQLSALGPAAFAKDFVAPLMHEIGDAWESDALCIASEHLGSTIVRRALEAALRGGSRAVDAPTVLFATPPGERHEIGLLIAAIVAQAAGARPLYLGTDLPLEEIVRGADRAGVQTVAISVVNLPEATAGAVVRDLREQLSKDVDLWVGGEAAPQAAAGIAYLGSLDELERRVSALCAHMNRKAG